MVNPGWGHIVFGAGLCALSGCFGAGRLLVVENPPAADSARLGEGLHAASAEVDITPPPGAPMYGYSLAGARAAKGYWLRLYGRVIVLQYETTRVAMVQLDLGASSGLLHRKLAKLLAKDGIDPARLLMATTHTHGGPGGFFGDRFYNHLVAGRPAFDERMVDFFAERIAEGVRDAISRLRPARLGVWKERVANTAASNRSKTAWLENFADGRRVPDEVNRSLTLIRVDVENEPGKPRPLACWAIYGVHGNSMPPSFELLHGDVHGLAARMIAAAIEARWQLGDHFVAAMANGAEGDVAPGEEPGAGSGKQLTFRVAREIADAALAAFTKLEPTMADERARRTPIVVAYGEISMRGAGTWNGRLCPEAFIGGPQLRGSEEGRGIPGFLAPMLRTDEGVVDPPRGCVATKVRALGALLPTIVASDDLPDVLPFQVLMLGPKDGSAHQRVALAAVPGEPTTEVGRGIERALDRELGASSSDIDSLPDEARMSAALGLANAYATYFTTGPEYVAQAYEGGATLYGGHQGTFAVEQLSRLAFLIRRQWEKEKRGETTHGVLDTGFYPRRVFRPGEQIDLLPTGKACDPSDWKALSLSVKRPTTTFRWKGARPDERCALPRIRIECGGQVLRDNNGWPQTDAGVGFEVRREGAVWSAEWTVAGESASECSFVVAEPGELRSPAFVLPPRGTP